MSRQPLPRLRCAGVATTATVLAGAVARVLAGRLDFSVTSTDRAVVQVCLLALLGCLAWAWAAACSVVVEAWRGAPAPGPGVPVLVRRAVLAACGAALASSLAVPAQASDPGPDLGGLPLPERALGPAHPGKLPDPEVVVVRSGDSLWLITARALPPGASAATVTAGWHRLYRTNRAVIGADPDLIHPGQRLLLPSPVATS